jgi:hypothetical protein
MPKYTLLQVMNIPELYYCCATKMRYKGRTT